MKKIVCAVLAVIIAIGIIVIATVGFNVDIIYSNHREIKVYLGKEYNINDVKQIVKEVMPNEKIAINEIEKFSDMFVIKTKKVSKEQEETLKQKFAEKYEIQDTSNLITVSSVGKLKIRDLIKPYITPVLLATIIILGYMALRYKKLGMGKVVIEQLIILAIAAGLLLSVMAISRCPVNRLFIPAGITVYVLTITLTNIQFTNQLIELEKKEKNVKKA